MISKRCLSLAILNILLGTVLSALPLESLLSEDLVRQLLQSGTVSRERFDTLTLGMVPRYDVLNRHINNSRSGLDPNISVESLRLYKKPFSQENWTATEKVELYNGISTISTLKGLEYFSKSRNRMHLLFESSAVVEGPNSKNPMPDPVYRTPPAEITLYARQKDGTFGDNVYKFNYYSNDSSFIVYLENTGSLSYGVIPVVDKSKLRSIFAIIDCGPYLLIYGVSMAKASMLPGMKQRVGESINNRANALLSWLFRKADRAFGKT
ncbi:MAG: hypothetical protein LBH07_00085 [Treponema sp.]|jgi:hypothetical protein|nr:hypothetical protein [Treponema sp.]